MIFGINGYIGSGKDTMGTMIQRATRDVRENSHRIDYTRNTFEIKKFATKLKLIASILTGIPVEKFENQEFKKTFLPEIWNKWVIYQLPDDNYDNRFPVAYFTSEEEAYEYLRENDRKYQQINEGSIGLTITRFLQAKYEKMTVRQFLQYLGTEAIRNNIHPNAWVNALFADYKEDWNSTREANGKFPDWVITDCRFPNEAQAIKDRGGIVVRVNRPECLEGKQTRKNAKGFDVLVEGHPSEISLDDWNFDYITSNHAGLGTLEMETEKMLRYFEYKVQTLI